LPTLFLNYNLPHFQFVAVVAFGILSAVGFTEECIKKDKVCEEKELGREDQIPLSVNEARGQTRLLHETLHSTLLIVHLE